MRRTVVHSRVGSAEEDEEGNEESSAMQQEVNKGFGRIEPQSIDTQLQKAAFKRETKKYNRGMFYAHL
jgi:hypothetical protein